MKFSEAEIQILVAMQELRLNEKIADAVALASCQKIFRKYLEDWPPAIETLIGKELMIREDANALTLTSLGEIFARQFRRDRPPIWYWYKEYYEKSSTSKAEAEFQKRLNNSMGILPMNLEMPPLIKESKNPIASIMEFGAFTPQTRLLHIGCGDGSISEHISDQTQARVTGIDFVPEAIRLARERTAAKKERLTFLEGNASHLHFPTNSFDATISLGPLAFVENLSDTVRQMAQITRPGGIMAMVFDDEYNPVETSQSSRHCVLGEVLQARQLPFTHYDLTAERLHRAQLIIEIAEDLKSSFEDEGNLFLYEKHTQKAQTLIKKLQFNQFRSSLYQVQLP